MSSAPPDPFFIVGAPRSGTTLLQSLLNRLPAVIVAPETHFMRLFARPRWQRDIAAPGRFEALVDAVVRQPEFADFGVPHEAFRRTALAGGRAFADVLRALLETYRAAHNPAATYVGEKTPSHALFIDELARMFPGARFVHIVRDPRAVAESLRRMPWGPGGITTSAFMWREHVEAVDAAARRLPGRVVRLRYEELVADHEAVLRSVCSALGLPFTGAALDPAASGGFDAEREPWKAGAQGPVRRDLSDRWRGTLGRGEQLAAAAAAGPAAGRWSYRVPAAATLAAPLFTAAYWLHRLLRLGTRKARAGRHRLRAAT